MDTNKSDTPAVKSGNRLLPVLLIVLAALGGVFYWFYFGGGAVKEPEIFSVSKKEAESAQQAPEPPKLAPLPAVTAPEASAAQKAELEKSRGLVPSTLPALELAPDSAHMAAAIPPVANLLDQWIPVIQRVFRDELDIRAEVNTAVRNVCGMLGTVPDGDAVAALQGIGLDTTRPAGIFLAPQQALQEMLKTAAANKTLEATLDLEMPAINDLFAFAAVLPISDRAKAEQVLKLVQALLGGGAAPSEETVDGFTVTIMPGVGAYCLADQWAVLGNSGNLVKEAVARFKAPREVRYGSESCPAYDANEVVILTFMGRAFSFLRPLAETAMADQPALKTLIEAQLKEAEAMLPTGDADDPTIVTLSVTGEKIELRSRIDTATHKGLLEQMGVPQPLELVRKLPENTGGLVALYITQNVKTQLSNSAKQSAFSLPASAKENEKKMVQQISTYVDQAMGALGTQFTVGIAGVNANGLPAVYALLESNNPVLPQLAMGLAGAVVLETLDDGVQIQKINRPLPLGLEVYGAMSNKVWMIATDLDGLKAVIDRVKNNTTTQVLETFEPPIDLETPRFLLIAIKPQVYLDSVKPTVEKLLSSSTALSVFNDVMIEVARLIHDLRFQAELNGSWLENRMILNLNPAV